MANLQSMAILGELDGVLPVDKPLGISAHDVMHEVKRHFNLVKVGHGGTLPVNATGVFPVLLGDATRVSNELMSASSVWEGSIRLGRITETFDREGRVLEERPVPADPATALGAALPEFLGDVFLAEPAFTAVKIHGHDGYDVIGPDRPAAPRLTHVFSLRFTAFEGPIARFELKAGKGVPVRTLFHELGLAAGCGASVETLRRVRFGKLGIEGCVTLARLLADPRSDLPARVLSVPAVFAV